MTITAEQYALHKRMQERAKTDQDLADLLKWLDSEMTYCQTSVDKICHYRNLAIVLGAKPEQMQGSFDRKLCEDGIDKDDNGNGYHMSVQDTWDDLRETWEELEVATRERDEARAQLQALADATGENEAKVAALQREADATKVESADDGVPLQCLADDIRATPLVTGDALLKEVES